MRSNTVLVVSCFAAALLFTSIAEAGKGKKRKPGDKDSDHSSGTIEFIIDHAAELKLTPDQISKLDALQAGEETAMSDPGVVAILQKVHEARRTGNQQALTEQKERLNARIKEVTGGKFGELKGELNKILSAAQQAALADLKQKSQAKDPNAPKDDPKLPPKGINPFEL